MFGVIRSRGAQRSPDIAHGELLTQLDVEEEPCRQLLLIAEGGPSGTRTDLEAPPHLTVRGVCPRRVTLVILCRAHVGSSSRRQRTLNQNPRRGTGLDRPTPSASSESI